MRMGFCLLGFSGALLIGCSAFSPGSAVAVAQLDPLETPPDEIEVAVSVPNALRLRDGDAQLSFGFVPDDPDNVDAIIETVPLSISERSESLEADPQDAVYVFALGEREAAEVGRAQQEIKALKDEGVSGVGTLSIGVDGGCLVSELPDNLPVATWLRTSSSSEFIQLTRKVDLFRVLPDPESAALRANLAPC